jgi:hypothetical protein
LDVPEDHNPPYFHATYGDFEILTGITDLHYIRTELREEHLQGTYLE